jgi:uncharacterized membrane protein
MKRLKSIDIIRGTSMLWMFLGHLMHWWLKIEDLWFYDVMFSILDVLGASAFIFISGVSTTLSYRKRRVKIEKSGSDVDKRSRNEYLFRALLLLILALIYNVPIAFYTQNPFNVWIWYILLTIAVSLFMAWPLIKLPKSLRICIGVGIWVANQYLIAFLTPYEGQNSLNGALFHLLYNGYPILDPILTFFPFLLIGTVVGDIIFEAYIEEDQKERRAILKKRLILPSFLLGGFLIIIGVSLKFPDFLNSNVRSFSWAIYSLGILIILLSLLLTIEEYEIITTKRSYKFLFYFSYYSLTIFLAHNLLFFVFTRQISASYIIYFVIGTTILVGLLLRYAYKKLGGKISIKAQISKMSIELARRVERRSKLHSDQ